MRISKFLHITHLLDEFAIFIGENIILQNRYLSFTLFLYKGFEKPTYKLIINMIEIRFLVLLTVSRGLYLNPVASNASLRSEV